ncbi:MAG TPA: hypothetical protein VLA96_03415, partial [Terriglobales bacterium]|nr:hypothetical protein [Terriglobales bacterium]
MRTGCSFALILLLTAAAHAEGTGLEEAAADLLGREAHNGKQVRWQRVSEWSGLDHSFGED